MRPTIRYILLTALRDRLFLALLLGILAATWISRVLGGTALVETQEMSLAFGAVSSRLILMIGLVVFLCFHVRHAFDTKEIDVFLSRPVSRARLVLAYWLGFAFVGLLLVLPTCAIIAQMGLVNRAGFFIWGLSLIMEAGLVVAIALFASFTLKSAVASVMASLGFYVLSRMMAFFLITTESAFVARAEWQGAILTYALKTIAVVIPRLDLFSKTEWLVYGAHATTDLMLFAAQAFIFIPLLLLATMLDFQRRQF